MVFEFKLPDIGEGVVEGEIVRWLVETGQEIAEDEPMVEVMTDKATVEIPSPVKGRVVDCRGEEGDIVDVGATLVVIEIEGQEGLSEKLSSGGASSAKEAEDQKKRTSTPRSRGAGGGLATPAVRKLAREKGVDLAAIPGTGPGERVTVQDVERAVGLAERGTPFVESEILPYRGLRRQIGKHLTLAKQKAVHYTYMDEFDVSDLVKLRLKIRRSGRIADLNYLPFVVMAVVSALQEYPLVNSRLDEERGEIELLNVFHIGIATATPEGLVVPVVKNADQKSMKELSEEIRTLAERSRSGKASVDDLRGSTFTVTSLGPLGGLAATPVINYPEVAILAVHKIVKRPVVVGGRITVRDMLNLSLSCDHRVVDGAVAAQFVRHVGEILESPGLLLTERSS